MTVLAPSLALVAAVLLTGMLPVNAAAQVPISPHRAAYDLSLKRASDRSGIESVRGRMVIEVQGSICEGWSIDFRMINQYLLPRGTSRLSDNRSSTWEAGDGSRMHHTSKHLVNNKPEAENRSKAERGSDGKPGAGEIVLPKPEEFTIPADAIFPIEHQKRLLSAAKAGETRDRSVVYDGSDGTKSYLAISFIGPQIKDMQQGGEGAEALQGRDVWPVSISYYDNVPDTNETPTPSYQVSFRMFDNGVAGDLTLDYGEFTLDGKLAYYEELKSSACD